MARSIGLTNNGRPTKFSKKLGSQICVLRSQGKSQREICQAVGIGTTTLTNWLYYDDTSTSSPLHQAKKEFREKYARAFVNFMSDEMLDSYNISQDIMKEACEPLVDAEGKAYGIKGLLKVVDKKGKTIDTRFDNVFVQIKNMEIELRKWQLARLAPNKFGTTIDVKSRGEGGATITVTPVVAPQHAETPDEWEEMAQRLKKKEAEYPLEEKIADLED